MKLNRQQDKICLFFIKMVLRYRSNRPFIWKPLIERMRGHENGVKKSTFLRHRCDRYLLMIDCHCAAFVAFFPYEKYSMMGQFCNRIFTDSDTISDNFTIPILIFAIF